MERSENPLAAEVFDQLCSAGTLKSILNYHRQLCDLLHIRPTHINQFYPKLKAKLRSWRAQALWNKFDKRASHKCYNRGKACTNIRVLVIGAGPCGLRAAIEAQLLGAKVVVIEKRDRITRNNVLHLWPFVIHDLKALGAKKFFGRFCAGAIDHISIRQLQCILLKVALILGVEIHEGVGFESVIPPPDDQADERVGWRVSTSPPDHPVSQYEFNALIGADGKRNTLDGFKRKEFRGKLAIAITANFINRHTEAEARVEEISGVAFIFNQKFFKDLYASTGIDLENIVYYKDDTHYFVMTAKKHSLIDKGVIISDYSDTAKLLSADNVDKTALMEYAREAADFSTGCRLPQLEFAVNHYGQPDVAMFDFTSMYAAENASRFIERRGHRLYVTLVGDSLLEPFWPTGSGCARGFLSSMDACWALRSWGLGAHPLEVVAERESIYRLLGQTTPENLHRDLQAYTLDPCSRYPNLNSRSVLPIQMKTQFDTDDLNEVDQFLKAPKNTAAPNSDTPKKRKRREAVVHADTLLHWLQRQVALCDEVSIENVTSSFKDGMALCAILNRYRPHLLDFASLDREEIAKNNQLAFDILEKELAIPPVMTGEEMAECDVPDKLAMLSYLSQVYEAFRGEIPHIKHPKMEETEEGKDEAVKAQLTRIRTLAQMSPQQKLSLLGKLANRPSRKRRSHLNSDRLNRSSMDGKGGGNGEEFSGRVKDIEAKLRGTHTDKKPKDLLRAIGKIEKTDWNVKQIEQKIEENRMGRGSSKRSEKVPKWSKEQFEDKFTAVERKLRARSNKADDNKYNDIDITMKKIDKKVKEGFSLEQGKVSAMAEHLAKIHRQPEPAVTPTGKQASVMMPSQGASELCHFCNKRVYLMERLSAEGRFFHRGCFRCQYCSTSLRLGNYAFDREGKYGHKFFCVQHFGLQGATSNRRREEVKPMVTTVPKTPPVTSSLQPDEMVDMGSTPERVEFENSTCLEDEVEEDEFTDRNFGLSTTDVSETEGSDSSSESDGFAEAEDGGLDPDLETLRLAKDWTRRYASSYSSDSQDESDTEMEDDEEDVEKKKNQEGSDSGSETEGARGTIRRSHHQRLRRMRNVAASHSGSIRNLQPPSQSFSVLQEIKTDQNKSWVKSGLDKSSRGDSKVSKPDTTSSSSTHKTIVSEKNKPHLAKRPLGAKPGNDAALSVPKEVPSKPLRSSYSLDSKKPKSLSFSSQKPPTYMSTDTQKTDSGSTGTSAHNPSPHIATATQVVQKSIFSVVQPLQSAVGFISKMAEKAVCTVTPSLQKAEVNVVLPTGDQLPSCSKKSGTESKVLKESNIIALDSPKDRPGIGNFVESKPKRGPTALEHFPNTNVLKSDESVCNVAVRDQPSLKSPKLVSESFRLDQGRKIKDTTNAENILANPPANYDGTILDSSSTPPKPKGSQSSNDNPEESPSSATRRSVQRPLQIFRDLLDQYSPHKYYDSIINARESQYSAINPATTSNDSAISHVNGPSDSPACGTSKSIKSDQINYRTNQEQTQNLNQARSLHGMAQTKEHDLANTVRDISTELTPSPPSKDVTRDPLKKQSVTRIPLRDSINISRKQFFSQHFDGTKFSLVQEPNPKGVVQLRSPSQDQTSKNSFTNTAHSAVNNVSSVRRPSLEYLNSICAPSSQSETAAESLMHHEPCDEPDIHVPNSSNGVSWENPSPSPLMDPLKTNERLAFKSRFLKSSSSLYSPASSDGMQLSFGSAANTDSAGLPVSEVTSSQELSSASNPSKPFKSRFLKYNSSASTPTTETSELVLNPSTHDSSVSENPLLNLSLLSSSRPAPFKSRFLKSSSSYSLTTSDSSPTDVNTQKVLGSKIPVSSDISGLTIEAASLPDAKSSQLSLLTCRNLSSVASTEIDFKSNERPIGSYLCFDNSNKESHQSSNSLTGESVIAISGSTINSAALSDAKSTSTKNTPSIAPSRINKKYGNGKVRSPLYHNSSGNSEINKEIQESSNSQAGQVVIDISVGQEGLRTVLPSHPSKSTYNEPVADPVTHGLGCKLLNTTSETMPSTKRHALFDVEPANNIVSTEPISPESKETQVAPPCVHAISKVGNTSKFQPGHGSPTKTCRNEQFSTNVASVPLPKSFNLLPTKSDGCQLKTDQDPVSQTNKIKKLDIVSKPKGNPVSPKNTVKTTSGVRGIPPDEHGTIQGSPRIITRSSSHDTKSEYIEETNGQNFPDLTATRTPAASNSNATGTKKVLVESASPIKPSGNIPKNEFRSAGDPIVVKFPKAAMFRISDKPKVVASSSGNLQVSKDSIYKLNTTQNVEPAVDSSNKSGSSTSSKPVESWSNSNLISATLLSVSPANTTHIFHNPNKQSSKTSNLMQPSADTSLFPKLTSETTTRSSVSAMAPTINSESKNRKLEYHTSESKDQCVPASSSITVKLPKSAIFRTPFKVQEPVGPCYENTSCSSSFINPVFPSAAVPKNSTHVVEPPKQVEISRSSSPSNQSSKTGASKGISGCVTSPKDCKMNSKTNYDAKGELVPACSSIIVKLPKSAIFRTSFNVQEPAGKCIENISSSTAALTPAFPSVALSETPTHIAEPPRLVKTCQASSPSNTSSKTCSSEGVAGCGTPPKDRNTNSEKDSDSSTYLPSISSDVKVTVSADAPSNRTITVVMKVPKRKIQQLRSQLTPNSNTTEPLTQYPTS